MQRIFVGATVRTMDPSQPVADAIVVRDGKIAKVCRMGGLDLDPTRNEEVIDLRGKVILPGFIDSHIHFSQVVWEKALIDLSCVRNPGELRETLGANQMGGVTGEWTIGRGLRCNVLEEVRAHTGKLLDVFAGKEPLILGSEDTHTALINTRGAELLEKDGVISQTGRSSLESCGEFILLRESEAFAAWRWIDKSEKKLREEDFEKGVSDINRLGVTGIYSFEMLSDSLSIAKSRACRRGLKTTIGFYEDDLETVLSSGPDSVGEGVELGGLKLFVDGTLGSRTALLLEPYEGGETCGMEGQPLDSLKHGARIAAENGIGLCIHAIGDRAGRIALDLLEEISGKRDLLAARDRIEHVQLLHPDDLSRFSETGAIASIQPTHIVGDRIAAEQAWGERCRYAYPLRSLIENGARVAFGSDAPAGRVNPLEAIRLAVTRDIGEGEPHKDRWYSGETISIGDAIASHTVEGAFAAGMEGSTGMIHEGFRADLVILSRDPFRSEEDLLKTEVIATLVGGEEAYDEEGLFISPA